MSDIVAKALRDLQRAGVSPERMSQILASLFSKDDLKDILIFVKEELYGKEDISLSCLALLDSFYLVSEQEVIKTLEEEEISYEKFTEPVLPDLYAAVDCYVKSLLGKPSQNILEYAYKVFRKHLKKRHDYYITFTYSPIRTYTMSLFVAKRKKRR